jgi:hypothetical protein
VPLAAAGDSRLGQWESELRVSILLRPQEDNRIDDARELVTAFIIRLLRGATFDSQSGCGLGCVGNLIRRSALARPAVADRGQWHPA